MAGSSMSEGRRTLDRFDLDDLRWAVRELCARYPAEYWRRADDERAYPEEFVSALTEAGYLAMLIPTEYGGSGASLVEAATVIEEIHRSGGSAASCHGQIYMMLALVRHASLEQRQRFLPALARGHLRLQSFGVTEPTSGSDTASLQTRARREGSHYVINGQKLWTSRLQHSDLLLLLARTSDAPEGGRRTDGLSLFLVDVSSALGQGMKVQPLRTMVNHETNAVYFDGLAVGSDRLIGEEGQGFRYVLDGMNAERIVIASECIGDGHWFVTTASKYAAERTVFGRPIGQNQGVAFPLARCYAAVRAAALMRDEAARKFDLGGQCGEEANLAKLLAADASWEAANAAVQTLGGFAFAPEYDVERKFRETRLYQVAPVSTNLILAYLAQNVLGLPRSY